MQVNPTDLSTIDCDVESQSNRNDEKKRIKENIQFFYVYRVTIKK